MNLRSKKAILLACLVGAAPSAVAVETVTMSADDLSLAELMNLDVTIAALTSMRAAKIPVSVTTITREDIQLTPARNIYDLLEVYVPGVYVLEHNSSPHPVFRGLGSDRNEKFLFLVDGRLMNDKTVLGAITDLGNWNMEDIDMIRVVRGAGSITYGPGAIGGVILVTTKRAETAGFDYGRGQVAFDATYNSKGLSGEVVWKTNPHVQLYSQMSIRKTEGAESKYYSSIVNGLSTPATNGGISSAAIPFYGVPGEDATAAPYYASGTTSALMKSEFGDLYGDAEAGPQMKVHVNLDIFKDSDLSWNLWSRYTKEGGALPWTNGKTYVAVDQAQAEALRKSMESKSWAGKSPTEDSIAKYGGLEYRNRLVDEREQLTLFGENKWKINDMFSTRTNASMKAFSYSLYVNEKGSTKYRRAFGQDEFIAQSILFFDDGKNIKAAFGPELLYSKYRSPWGKGEGEFVLGQDENIFWDPASKTYGPMFKNYNAKADTLKSAAYISNGWMDHNMISILSEINLDYGPYLGFLLAGRYDKHEYAGSAFSPKIAYMCEFVPDQFIKAVAQQSVRYHLNETMFPIFLSGDKEGDPEKLQTLELIYSNYAMAGTEMNLSGFYNSTEILGLEKIGTSLGTTEKLGTLKTTGFEFESKYTADKFSIGFNHSSLYVMDWTRSYKYDSLGNKLPSLNGISYSDFYYNYNQTLGTPAASDDSVRRKYKQLEDKLFVEGIGNSLTNGPQHVTKLFAKYKPWKRVTLHADTRINWGFQGYKDGIDGCQAMVDTYAAANRTPADSVLRKAAALIQPMLDDIKSRSPWQTEMRLDLSARVELWTNLFATLNVQNIPLMGDNVRFLYSSGEKYAYPTKGWLYDPTNYSAKVDYAF